MATPYSPQSIFSPDPAGVVPRVFAAPPKYVQGPGVLKHVGRYLSLSGLRRVAVLASSRGHTADALQVAESLAGTGVTTVKAVFDGECSLPEITARVDQLSGESIDGIIAVGGGKCVDAGKCIAYRLGVGVVIVPTLASNDAPCSALSVLYAPDGGMQGAEFFPQHPLMVVVDTQVVANAPERYLVAGMGDAMATWYEAKVCIANPRGLNALGGKPTLAACAMGEICATTLYADAEASIAAVRVHAVDDSLERVVEANTLLSGLGFESGGLAVAHGVAMGYTFLPEVEKNYLHGEMVAMGLVAQLMMEGDASDAQRVAEFCARVGLPIHLEQLSLTANDARLEGVVEVTMGFQPLANLPFEPTHERVRDAILGADTLGQAVADAVGDTAYRRLHAA